MSGHHHPSHPLPVVATSKVLMLTADLPVGDVKMRKPGKPATKAANGGRIWRRRSAWTGAKKHANGGGQGDTRRFPEDE